MNKPSFCIALLIALMSFTLTATGKELVREFKGTSSQTTAEFEVKAPWILDWRAKGDYPGSMTLQISLVKSPSGEYMGKISKTNWISNGVRLFDQSGKYRLQVRSSLADWTLRIEELSDEEAKAYTPKINKQADF